MLKRINLLREFSIPLLAGVLTALVWANVAPDSYHKFNHDHFLGPLSFHFVTNDIFMAFFFAIAAVEITQSCLPGGDMSPLNKALNPLLATAGGVVGPVGVYLALNSLVGSSAFTNGWGIPTATDIAFAWLAARLIFGKNHPVIAFLLLLAIADDAIGLVIIAVFYPDPVLPVAPPWLMLTAAGMLIAFILRRKQVKSYWPYLLFGGVPSWFGLFKAHLHPALALVFIIPFLPHPTREVKHMFEEDPKDYSPLARFEHEWKIIVDFGLFMFGLANAGVGFSAMNTVTWLVFCALLFGKVTGIFVFALLGEKLGFPLPQGMGRRHLLVAGIIAGIGFTVALFVAGEAFTDPVVQGAAKMGAILSIAVFPVAMAAAKLLGIRKRGHSSS
ncbi:Na+/H+ antiporter NhaA [Geotalea uraniireducens]|uniref:Na(+)/H(+) antiporter NhaA n=1 Tax=Geotalea uraniireducens (strain Rf4) TaxID=351605 RepID=NHAA_GEOUR|nr:Na+/H+ antiporter NhaA [Geotalea uraniireducens]A5G6V8.1 RecName: Full=Na(+)/H(+) antiporter NhaA; AltName: Full=Sodium/proton antiporter NhaA [Geotalea uraniireducens Rf4]ABQ27526.1 sodium/proton antiporter, NhaA family [Geotalea uraniireducens Rf4]